MNAQERESFHNLQVEFENLQSITKKRAQFMRDALHAIMYSGDNTTADELRQIALMAWKADNQIVRKEFEKYTKQLHKSLNRPTPPKG